MGLFKANYAKPGPGVSKDAPQKRRIIVFFEILGRKYWKLAQANLVFLAMCLVIFALVLLLNNLIFNFTNNGVIVNLVSFLPLSLLSFPITGLTYITRNFAREEHAFVLYDYFNTIKKNWKTCLLHGLVSFFVYYFAFFSFTFYRAKSLDNIIFLVPMIISIIVVILFTFMQYYIFTMFITFKLKYRHILKNALIFSIAGLLRNFLLTLFFVPIWGLVVICLFAPFLNGDVEGAAVLWILPMPFLLFGLGAITSFIISFVTYPLMVKFMIAPAFQKEDGTEGGGEPKDETFGPTQEGDHYKPIEDKESEYVFENGRLVKKVNVESVFDDEVK